MFLTSHIPPKAALKEGLSMARTIEANLACLSLGSKLREEMWKREIAQSVVVFDVFDAFWLMVCFSV